MTDWSALRRDPAPGSPDFFNGLIGALAKIVEVADNGRSNLQGLAVPPGDWLGDSAESFLRAINHLPGNLGDLVDKHQSVIGALQAYAAELAALQNQALNALGAAQGAQTALSTAKSQYSGASGAYSSATTSYWEAHAALDGLEAAGTRHG